MERFAALVVVAMLAMAMAMQQVNDIELGDNLQAEDNLQEAAAEESAAASESWSVVADCCCNRGCTQSSPTSSSTKCKSIWQHRSEHDSHSAACLAFHAHARW